MDKVTQDKIVSKKVRLQGFKGFKLKNTQILIKSTSAFSNKQFGHSGKLLEKRSPVKVAGSTSSPGAKFLQYVGKPESPINSKFGVAKNELDSGKVVFLQNHSVVENAHSYFPSMIIEPSSMKGAIDTASSGKLMQNVCPTIKETQESHQKETYPPKRKEFSSAGSSDDVDEVMKRTREKRKLLQKSSETYTPKKKVRENENHCGVQMSSLDNLIIYTSEPTQEVSASKDSVDDALMKKSNHVEVLEFTNKTESPLVKNNEDSDVSSVASEKTNDFSCIVEQTLKSNAQQYSEHKSSADGASTTSHKDKLTVYDVKPPEHSSVEKEVEVKTPHKANISISDALASKNNQDFTETIFTVSNLNENHVIETNVTKPTLKQDVFHENLEGDLQLSVINKPTADLPSEISAVINDTSIPETTANSTTPNAFEVYASTSVNDGAPTSSVTTTDVTNLVLKNSDQDQSHQCPVAKSKLVYPAKKRYHEWFNTGSVPEAPTTTKQTDTVNQVGAISPISNAVTSPLLPSVSPVSCTTTFFSEKSNNDDFTQISEVDRDTVGSPANSVPIASRSDHESSDNVGMQDENSLDMQFPEKVPVAASPKSVVSGADSTPDTVADAQTGECTSISSDAQTSCQDTHSLMPVDSIQNETLSDVHEEPEELSISPDHEENNILSKRSGAPGDVADKTSSGTGAEDDGADGVKDPVSPPSLLYSGDMSPIIDYALSDSSSVGSMSPVDIRIPIDNCDIPVCTDEPARLSYSQAADADKQDTIPTPSDASSEPNTVIKQDNNKPPTFTFIEENLYLFLKKKSRARKEIRRMLCECIRGDEEIPCGENCLNRLLMIECSPRCPFGDRCTNKRFQHHEFVRTDVFETSWKGWGLQASENLSGCTLVMEYCGEVLDPVEFRRRSQLYSINNQQHFYFMALSQSEIIDATYKGNNSRFINHSCDPNCETQKWTVNGRLRVGFFTIRDVKAGEEITFDYQFERYGKEAQKCYCGAANCRGYLGQPPKENNSTIFSKSFSNEPEPSKNISKDAPYGLATGLQEFKQNTLENEISRLTNGLQTTKEVLLLSRLMVRSDTMKERLLCLKVIRKSSNQASLRAFLHFHGLTLIWSWMVDSVASTDEASNDVVRLKVEILNTLSVLPINNKNVLEDSKVLSMVKRWSKDPVVEDMSKDKSSDNVDDESNNKEVAEQTGASDQNESTNNLVNSSAIEERKQMCKRILALSSQLLNIWKNLKEVYRIPKRQKSATQNADSEYSAEEPMHFKTSTSSSTSVKNRRHERERSPVVVNPPSYRDKFADLRNDERKIPLKSKDKDEDSKPSSKLDTGDQYAWLETSKNVRLTREEHRRQFERVVLNKNEKKSETNDSSSNSSQLPFQQQTAATAMASTTSQNVLPSNTVSTTAGDVTFTPSGYSGNLIQINPTSVHPPPPQCSSVQSSQPLTFVMNRSISQTDPALSTSYLTSSSQGQPISVIGGAPPPNTQVLAPNHASMYLSPYTMQPTNQLSSTFTPTVNNSGVTILGYDGLNAIVLLTPEQLKELTDLLAFKALQQTTVQTTFISHPSIPVLPQPVQQTILQPPAQVAVPANQVVVPANQGMVPVNQGMLPANQGIAPANQSLVPANQVMVSANQGMVPANQVAVPANQVAVPVNQVTVPANQVVTPAAESLVVPHNYSPTPNKVATDPALAISETSSETSNVAVVRSPPKDPRPLRLPPNWKTASDPDGCVYYYHVITRQTQWEPPTWDAAEEDMVGKKEEEMEISTPTIDVPSKKKTEKLAATAIVASDTDRAKKAKESFRSRMSQHIVTCLSSYRKSDCKVGRITTTEDFKRLARKLTYNILMKEIKQVQVWEDLECNANVKHKAKEYVRKYMAKMGPVYRSKDDESTR